MNREIDLTAYLAAVWDGKWLLCASILLGMLFGFQLQRRVPQRYEAVALVTIIESRDIIQFDPRFLDVGEKQPLHAFPELALSDEALGKIVLQGEPCDAYLTLAQIRGMATASLGDDSTLLRLRIVGENPDTVVCLTNQWAETFVVWANQLFGDQNQGQVAFYANQLREAEAALAETNEALISFQSVNASQIISHTLSFYQTTRVELLEDQRRIETLEKSSISLKEKLRLQDDESAVSYADQLTFFQLQQQVLNGESSPAILLQTNQSDTLTTGNIDEQVELIENLVGILETQSVQVEQNLIEIEPAILSLQQKQQTLLVEQERLQREINIATDTAVTLAYKLEEERLKANDASNVFRLASRANAQPRVVSLSSTTYITVSTALAFALALLALILRSHLVRSPTSRQLSQMLLRKSK